MTAAAATLDRSLSLAYEALDRIQFKEIYYRRDSGRRVLERAHLDANLPAAHSA